MSSQHTSTGFQPKNNTRKTKEFMKLKPSDYIINFLTEHHTEQAIIAKQQPRYEVVEVTQMSTTYCIASWNIGIPFKHEGVPGYLRPFWCIEIGGFLEIKSKPNYISALVPHWIFAETLESDLTLNDDTLVDCHVDWCEPFWVVGDPADNEIYPDYVESLGTKLKARYQTVFKQASYTECLTHIENVIVDAWEQYWATSTYKFKAHNWLNHTLNKKIKRVLKTTLKKSVVFVSYEFHDGKRGSTILSRRDLDDMTTMDERWVSYAPKFDADNSGDALRIKGWDIYAEVEENGKLKLRTVSSVVNVGGFFYRVDRKIVEHEGLAAIELPENYIYAPETSIYDAVFHSKRVGSNVDVASNFFVDPLARELKKKAKGFGLFVEQQKKKTLAPTWNQFTIDTSLNDEVEPEDTEL